MKRPPSLSFSTVVSIGVVIIVVTIGYFSLDLVESNPARAALIRRTNESCRQMGGSVRQWSANGPTECQLPGGPIYYLDVERGKWTMPDLRRGEELSFAERIRLEHPDQALPKPQQTDARPNMGVTISSSTTPGWMVAATDSYSIEYPVGWKPIFYDRFDSYIVSNNWDFNNDSGVIGNNEKLLIWFGFRESGLETQTVKDVLRMPGAVPLTINGQPAAKYTQGDDLFSTVQFFYRTADGEPFDFSCLPATSVMIDWCEQIAKTFKDLR